MTFLTLLDYWEQFHGKESRRLLEKGVASYRAGDPPEVQTGWFIAEIRARKKSEAWNGVRS